MEYYSAIKWNNVTCSDMDEPRYYCTKWNKSDRERLIWYHIHVESKMRHKWTYLQNRNRLTDIENKLMVTKGERGGEGYSRSLGLINYCI